MIIILFVQQGASRLSVSVPAGYCSSQGHSYSFFPLADTKESLIIAIKLIREVFLKYIKLEKTTCSKFECSEISVLSYAAKN